VFVRRYLVSLLPNKRALLLLLLAFQRSKGVAESASVEKMLCCGNGFGGGGDGDGGRRQSQRNKDINAELRKEKDDFRSTHRLLLLGGYLCWIEILVFGKSWRKD